MGYRNVKRVLISIYELSEDCGLFFSGNENNGYGCKSKSKDKAYPGCCYAFDCPLAFEADIEDLKKYDAGMYEEYKNSSVKDWVVQYRECCTSKKLLRRQECI